MADPTSTHAGLTLDLGETSATKQRTTLDDIRSLGTVHVWHPTEPDAADVLGISRALAWRMAKSGELPTLRLGAKRVVVPVQALLAMLGESTT